MPVKKHLLGFALSLAICATSVAQGFDAFLLLEGIPGESTDSKHKDWIDVLSFSHGLAKADRSEPLFSDFTVGKWQDKSSPELALRAANRKPISRALLELTQSSGSRLRFYQVSLSNCVVRAWDVGGNAGTVLPTESIALEYSWISWTYTEFDATGRPRGDVSAYWDIVRNRGGMGETTPFHLTGTKQGSNLVVTWPGRAGTTYNVTASPVLKGPYSFVQSVTQTSNGIVRLTFPIASGNLFYRAEASP